MGLTIQALIVSNLASFTMTSSITYQLEQLQLLLHQIEASFTTTLLLTSQLKSLGVSICANMIWFVSKCSPTCFESLNGVYDYEYSIYGERQRESIHAHTHIYIHTYMMNNTLIIAKKISTSFVELDVRWFLVGYGKT